MAVNVPISAFKRVPFGGATGNGDIAVIGVNWSAATFRMEVRNLPGDSGTALVTLTNASAGSQGISATYDAKYPLPDGRGTAPTTIIRIQIDEATLEALALATPANEPLALHYDLHATPSGEPKRVVCFGTFTIKPGVTQ